MLLVVVDLYRRQQARLHEDEPSQDGPEMPHQWFRSTRLLDKVPFFSLAAVSSVMTVKSTALAGMYRALAV